MAEKDEAVYLDHAAGKSGKAARGELWLHVRMRTEAALGLGNVWIIGKTANKTVYYNTQTAIGKAHGGVKVPGWHLPGFELAHGGAGGASVADDRKDGEEVDDDAEYEDLPSHPPAEEEEMEEWD